MLQSKKCSRNIITTNRLVVTVAAGWHGAQALGPREMHGWNLDFQLRCPGECYPSLSLSSGFFISIRGSHLELLEEAEHTKVMKENDQSYSSASHTCVPPDSNVRTSYPE